MAAADGGGTRIVLAALALTAGLAGCAAPGGGSGGGGSGGPAAEAGGRETARADPAPVSFTGMSSEDVTALLGPPDFRRNDGPTELLQYRRDTCVLDLFLFRDAGTTVSRVAHVEARSADLAPVARDACVNAVRQSRNDQTAL